MANEDFDSSISPLVAWRLTNRLTRFVSRRFNCRDDEVNNFAAQPIEIVAHKTIETRRSFILKATEKKRYEWTLNLSSVERNEQRLVFDATVRCSHMQTDIERLLTCSRMIPTSPVLLFISLISISRMMRTYILAAAVRDEIKSFLSQAGSFCPLTSQWSKHTPFFTRS